MPYCGMPVALPWPALVKLPPWLTWHQVLHVPCALPVVALRRMSNPGIAVFLNDKDEFVVTETARAINDDLSIEGALPALAELLSTTSFTNEALIRRAINANLRVGSEITLQNLINYSLKASAPAKMRAEALDALSVWANPSVLDRVDGRLRGPVHRDAAPLKNKLTGPIAALLKDREPAVRLSAAKAVALLDIRQAVPILAGLVKTDPEPDMRIESLASW